jgi:hypothetical protein
MDRKFISLIATTLVFGWLVFSWAVVASAEDKAGSASSAVSITGMTRQTFEALAPDATIDVHGESITKREFIARGQKAIKETAQKMQERNARAETEFAAHRKAFLDNEKAKLEEDNKKVQAEVARLVAAAASKGPTGKDTTK